MSSQKTHQITTCIAYLLAVLPTIMNAQVTTTWTKHTSVFPVQMKALTGGYCNQTGLIWLFCSFYDRVFSFDPTDKLNSNKAIVEHPSSLYSFQWYGSGIHDGIHYFNAAGRMYISQFFTSDSSFNYDYQRHIMNYTDFYVTPWKIGAGDVLFACGPSAVNAMYIFDITSTEWHQGPSYMYHSRPVVTNSHLYILKDEYDGTEDHLQVLNISGSIQDIISRNWYIHVFPTRDLRYRTPKSTAFYNKYSHNHEIWTWGGYAGGPISGIRMINLIETFEISPDQVATDIAVADTMPVYVDFQDRFYIFGGHSFPGGDYVYSVEYVMLTDAPTSITEEPTQVPTHPSKSPTDIPSGPPTLNPSKSPTDLPSGSPTHNPSKLSTDIPSISPTLSPSGPTTDNPSIAPTNDQTSDSKESYIVVIELKECDDDKTECEINTEDLNHRILVALGGDVEIMKTEIVRNSVELYLSVPMTDDNSLEKDVIQRNIEHEIAHDDQFGEVTVTLDESDEDQTVKDSWTLQYKFVTIAIIVLLIIGCVCGVSMCLCRKKKQKAQQDEVIIRTEMNSNTKDAVKITRDVTDTTSGQLDVNVTVVPPNAMQNDEPDEENTSDSCESMYDEQPMETPGGQTAGS
eukprot:615480_1